MYALIGGIVLTNTQQEYFPLSLASSHPYDCGMILIPQVIAYANVM